MSETDAIRKFMSTLAAKRKEKVEQNEEYTNAMIDKALATPQEETPFEKALREAKDLKD